MDCAFLDRGMEIVLISPIARQASDAHAGWYATVSTLLLETKAGFEETLGRRRALTASSTYGRAGGDLSHESLDIGRPVWLPLDGFTCGARRGPDLSTTPLRAMNLAHNMSLNNR